MHEQYLNIESDFVYHNKCTAYCQIIDYRYVLNYTYIILFSLMSGDILIINIVMFRTVTICIHSLSWLCFCKILKYKWTRQSNLAILYQRRCLGIAKIFMKLANIYYIWQQYISPYEKKLIHKVNLFFLLFENNNNVQDWHILINNNIFVSYFDISFSNV